MLEMLENAINYSNAQTSTSVLYCIIQCLVFSRAQCYILCICKISLNVFEEFEHYSVPTTLYLSQVDREYHVQKALFSAGFPVPEPLLYCSDVSVIGTEFYVMEHVQVSQYMLQDFVLFSFWVYFHCNCFKISKVLYVEIGTLMKFFNLGCLEQGS